MSKIINKNTKVNKNKTKPKLNKNSKGQYFKFNKLRQKEVDLNKLDNVRTPRFKKKYGQNFLKEQWVIDRILDRVNLNKNSNVFEIGPGSGFLTQSILAQNPDKLWAFEIDPEWANYLAEKFKDKKTYKNANKLKIFCENILDIDFKIFNKSNNWVLLANLPYNITFPILHLLRENITLLKEGVIMVQEEVAQKILKSSGKNYGYVSLFFQYYFNWELLDKIPPKAFKPAPKVFSRLLYFKPKKKFLEIKDINNFWKFIKLSFKFPRRTLRNNLAQTHYNLDNLDKINLNNKEQDLLSLRAQQLDINQLVKVWNLINI